MYRRGKYNNKNVIKCSTEELVAIKLDELDKLIPLDKIPIHKRSTQYECYINELNKLTIELRKGSSRYKYYINNLDELIAEYKTNMLEYDGDLLIKKMRVAEIAVFRIIIGKKNKSFNSALESGVLRIFNEPILKWYKDIEGKIKKEKEKETEGIKCTKKLKVREEKSMKSIESLYFKKLEVLSLFYSYKIQNKVHQECKSLKVNGKNMLSFILINPYTAKRTLYMLLNDKLQTITSLGYLNFYMIYGSVKSIPQHISCMVLEKLISKKALYFNTNGVRRLNIIGGVYCRKKLEMKLC